MLMIYPTASEQALKTKESHPWSYDPILLYKNSKAVITATVYTDRLYQWSSQKHNQLCLKHFGDDSQIWNYRSSEKIESFLRDWFENPTVVLAAVTEYCNVATGYPVWRLDYGLETNPQE